MSNKYSWIDLINGESEQIGSFNEPVKFAGQELESLSTPPTKHQMEKKKNLKMPSFISFQNKFNWM